MMNQMQPYSIPPQVSPNEMLTLLKRLTPEQFRMLENMARQQGIDQRYIEEVRQLREKP